MFEIRECGVGDKLLFTKRGRKKGKLDESQDLILGKTYQVASLEVVWKGFFDAPTHELGN